MQGRKNRENYVRLGKSIAKGKQGICLESDIENSISVQKEIYEARLTNSSTGGNGVPQIIIIPRTGRYHIKVRGASGGYGAHAKYLGYEPGSGASISRQDTSYLGLGRIYDPSSGGLYGNWAQDTFQNHMQDAEAFFEIWFD